MLRPADRQAERAEAALEPPQVPILTSPVNDGQDLAQLGVRPRPQQPVAGTDGLMQRDLLGSRPPGQHLLFELALLVNRPGPVGQLGVGRRVAKAERAAGDCLDPRSDFRVSVDVDYTRDSLRSKRLDP